MEIVGAVINLAAAVLISLLRNYFDKSNMVESKQIKEEILKELNTRKHQEHAVKSEIKNININYFDKRNNVESKQIKKEILEELNTRNHQEHTVKSEIKDIDIEDIYDETLHMASTIGAGMIVKGDTILVEDTSHATIKRLEEAIEKRRKESMAQKTNFEQNHIGNTTDFVYRMQPVTPSRKRSKAEDALALLEEKIMHRRIL